MDDQTEVPDEQQMLKDAETYREAAKEQVDADVDASLDEPDTFAKDLDEMIAKAPVLDTWTQKQNRHTALDHAMSLAKTPLGGMVVQTGHASAEDIVKNARVFLAFLNEEGTGA